MGSRRLAVILLLSFAACQKTQQEPYTYFQGKAMTMTYNIAVGKALSKQEKKEIQSILDETFEEVDRTFNNWNPNSELSRFNDSNETSPLLLSSPLSSLIAFCDKITTLSGGRFDPTVEPLSRIWRQSLQEKKCPEAIEVQQACDVLGWDKISIRDRAIQKKVPGVRLDLSSVAKGQAIDWIVERLAEKGYADVFVEWGGEFRAAGSQPDGSDWSVQVNPALVNNGQPMAPIPLKNAAIATSGDFKEKSWVLPADSAPDHQHHRYYHIVDPLTAQPLEQTRFSIAAVAVIAPSCALADALATAAMVFPTRKEAEEWAQEVVEFYPEVSFWIISYDEKR